MKKKRLDRPRDVKPQIKHGFKAVCISEIREDPWLLLLASTLLPYSSSGVKGDSPCREGAPRIHSLFCP